MPYEPKNGPAPADAAAEMAWDTIMDLAEKNGLIVSAYGGTATLAIPRNQREVAGLREKVLRAGLFELEP
jgi:hypothetical protein